MKPLNEILGYIGNPEAENVSIESQNELKNSIEMILFNFDNWVRRPEHDFTNTSFEKRLNLFKEYCFKDCETRKNKD